jgi:hypothetical protein
MILNLDDVIISKKDREAIDAKLVFTQECYDRLAKMKAPDLLDALYVEITGRCRKEMISRIERQFFMAFREAGERHVAKYILAQGHSR